MLEFPNKKVRLEFLNKMKKKKFNDWNLLKKLKESCLFL